MNIQKLQAVLEEVDGRIRREVRAGYLADDEIIEAVVREHKESGYPSRMLKPVAQRLLRDASARLRLEMLSWAPLTDCERLDAAFAELEARGVLCRQDYGCCGVCAADAIIDEVDEDLRSGFDVRGFAYFHAQDVDAALAGTGIHLSFGAAQSGQEAALAMGWEIVQELRRQGLSVQWNGQWPQRIFIDLDWKRRRPSPWLNSMGYRVNARLSFVAPIVSLSG